MNQYQYDKSVALTIKSIRELKRIKQFIVANSLNIDQSVYSRIERGETTITPGQLKIISQALAVSNFQILSIVEYELFDKCVNAKSESLTTIISNFVLSFQGYEIKERFNEMDYEFIIELIRKKMKEIK